MRLSAKASGSITAALLSTIATAAPPEGPLSAGISWSAGLAPDPGQELAGSLNYVVADRQTVTFETGVSVSWLQGFIKDSPPLLTFATGGNLQWRANATGSWLLSAEPSFVHRRAASVPALIAPGVRLKSEWLRESGYLMLHYSDERTIPAGTLFNPLRSRRREGQAGWGGYGAFQPRLQLFISEIRSEYEPNDPAFSYLTVGTDLSAGIQIRADLRGDFRFRFSKMERFASARLAFQNERWVSTHFEINRFDYPETKQWSSLAGITWSIQ